MPSPVVSVKEFQTRLQPLLEEFPGGAVVFDADGTLWKHDVGCMVYDYFCAQQLFLPDSESALATELLRINGRALEKPSANLLAQELRSTWRSGGYEELSVAQMQVWAYVGYTERRFREHVIAALNEGRHSDTLHAEVLELADWVRVRGGRALVVSASPLWVVEEATRAYGFARSDIAAGIPRTVSVAAELTIQAGMAEPLPYGPDKVVAGRRLIQEGAWLATLGDSVFDLEMMAAAKLAAGLGEKAAMLAGLELLPHGVRLRLGPSS